MFNRSLILLGATIILLGLTRCGSGGMAAPAPTATPVLAETLTFYNWLDDMPVSVLDRFTAEYGVKVNYLGYESMEEALEEMRAGQVYDVVNMDNRFIPYLIEEKQLARLHPGVVTNLKNVSANFRDLVYDPGNKYSAPYNWGTTGLVVRSDLVAKPVSRWADLWDTDRFPGKIVLWRGQPRETLGLALKSLGYSANSTDPAELETALYRLLRLKPHVIFLEDFDLGNVGPLLADGHAVVGMGFSLDALEGRQLNPAIQYVLPEEGPMLWGENFVIPANSPNQYTAELFLNFLLRPDVNAEIANQNYYATPNEAAYPQIKPEILHDPVIFPSNNQLKNAEIILPLNPAGEKLWAETWARFLAAP